MARANPFDPKVSSVSSVQYVTDKKESVGLQLAYPLTGQTTLTEQSPKGATVQPSTLTAWP